MLHINGFIQYCVHLTYYLLYNIFHQLTFLWHKMFFLYALHMYLLGEKKTKFMIFMFSKNEIYLLKFADFIREFNIPNVECR